MNTDNRQNAHDMIDHIFHDLLPARGMAERSKQTTLSHLMLEGSIALRDTNATLAELRRERRLLKNKDLEDMVEALCQTADMAYNGPDRLERFDEALLADLLEKAIAESQARIHFHFYDGIELAVQLPEARR